MKLTIKKCITAFMSLAAVLVLSSCIGGGKPGSTVIEKGDISYPIDTDETIKYWVCLPDVLRQTVNNFGDTEFAKEYIRRTGIKVEYIHPAVGEESESLNVIIASNALPDIIETNWLSKGPSSMIENGIIRRLNDYKEHMPHLNRFLAENADVDKQIKTDDGDYYSFPFVRDDNMLLSTSGFMVRSDWMKSLNLEVPETIEDWGNMLTALKTKCQYPLAFPIGVLDFFAGAYGIDDTYYVDEEGKVRIGVIEPQYKELLTTMNRWYEKGFIHKNAAILSLDLVRSNMLNNVSAVDFAAGGSGMGYYLSKKDKDGKELELEPLPYPSSEKGKKPEFGNTSFKYTPQNSAAITVHAKNPELCARFLDYSYGPEGSMLNNFGIENVSYEIIEGVPTYTDIITKNPSGLTMSQALPLYVRSSTEGPFVQDVRYIVQYYKTPAQIKALEVWGNNNHKKHLMPQVTTTAEESRELSVINGEIEKYKAEMLIRFVMGDVSIDKFDETVEHYKALGIERAIQIYQDALGRFNSR
ncbi:MAG: extracellular solute-binding protein [Clostridia bacterium]|nr:extracellular solute-binding protein [Clostridia bacterium]